MTAPFQVPTGSNMYISGMIAKTFCPFRSDGGIDVEMATALAKQLSELPGVSGLAINTAQTDQAQINAEALYKLACATRRGLIEGKMLLVGVDGTSRNLRKEISSFRTAGVDGVICSFQSNDLSNAPGPTLKAFTSTVDELALPVIVSLDWNMSPAASAEELVQLAESHPKSLF